MIATAITQISLAMPTAVTIESMENTRFEQRDLHHHRRQLGAHPRRRLALLALQAGMDLVGRLVDQEQPAGEEDDVLPEKPWPNSSNSGSVKPMTQAIASSRSRRGTSAMMMPRLRARGCWSFGSLPTSTAMNTRLSMPSTTSSAGQRQQAQPDLRISQPFHGSLVPVAALRPKLPDLTGCRQPDQHLAHRSRRPI